MENFITLLEEISKNDAKLQTFLNNIKNKKYSTGEFRHYQNGGWQFACEIPKVWQREFDALEYQDGHWRLLWLDTQRDGYYTRVSITSDLKDLHTTLTMYDIENQIEQEFSPYLVFKTPDESIVSDVQIDKSKKML